MEYKKNLLSADSYDVIVCGGGTAGAVAAIMSAKLGMKTLVIEKHGSLGGSQVSSFVQPLMRSDAGKDYVYSSINLEIVEEMKKYGYCIAEEQIANCQSQWFDYNILPKALEDLVYKYGGEILYDTVITDVIKEKNAVKSVIVFNTGGLCEYPAKYFIDATGNGDVSVFAGAKFTSGNKDGVNQAVSLRFEMAQVDLKKYVRFMDKEDEGKYWTSYYKDFIDKYNLLWTDRFISKAMDHAIEKALNNGDLTKQDIAHVQMFAIPGRSDFVSFNCPELGTQVNVLDPKFISKKYSDGRAAILRMAEFFRKYTEGFENAVISSIAPMLGIRETREIETEYILSIGDVACFTKFEDAYVKAAYPIDVHGQKLSEKHQFKRDLPKEEQYYEVPVRSLIVKGIDNLMVAGRCIGTDFYTQSTTRQQHSCRTSGEACALTVKQCMDRKIPCRQADGVQVRKAMRASGVTI